jgi:hypothetical protein
MSRSLRRSASSFSTMTRSTERISDRPRQMPIVGDLNFLLSELAICHEWYPPTNRRRGGRVVSLKFSDHFPWLLSSKLCLARRWIAKLGSCVFVDLVLRPRRR